jgi:hypothetical protein
MTSHGEFRRGFADRYTLASATLVAAALGLAVTALSRHVSLRRELTGAPYRQKSLNRSGASSV